MTPAQVWRCCGDAGCHSCAESDPCSVCVGRGPCDAQTARDTDDMAVHALAIYCHFEGKHHRSGGCGRVCTFGEY